ncbi:MAG: peptidylprolyl isomerase [Chromatiales bacterium]|jgi:peptidyl-prolyl cis-trans isomerase SurA
MHFRFLFYTLSLLFLLHSPLHAVALSDGEELDQIVAIVNENIIVRSELDREIKGIVSRLREANRPLPPDSIIEQQVLEKLITEKLQLDKAEKLGIDVTPDMLATAINNIAKNNDLTLAELRQALQAEGISFKTFRSKLQKEILLGRLKNQEITNKIVVSDAEIDNLLAQNSDLANKNKEYHLLHILIPVAEGSSAEQLATARQKANEVIEKIRQGADFATTAMLESGGRQALDGGDLGWLKPGEVPSLFSDVVNRMNKGEVSEPIRSSSGFHIIKLEEIKGAEKALVTQTHARHILINTGETVSDDDARTRLEQLYIRLQGGEDFATLARSHSDDKVSAIKGGDLGWVSPGSVVEKFQQEMDKLQPNELSQPFRTNFGWHLLEVLERRQHDNTEQILREQARRLIVERKSQEATELYLRRLRDEAYVEIRLDQE